MPQNRKSSERSERLVKWVGFYIHQSTENTGREEVGFGVELTQSCHAPIPTSTTRIIITTPKTMTAIVFLFQESLIQSGMTGIVLSFQDGVESSTTCRAGRWMGREAL
ncbi:hypothetical protein Pmani_037745 [Petrolisthes manimaculis]|uniref:Uncharacterized protein n=1 Tax=Petrolisthes manimaculis TaxID=1843537 RepID=A0AAE1NFQ1_9EUCA|nr:hypothetical protein Pmani_037745 [Petrolisthes manimaculis]